VPDCCPEIAAWLAAPLPPDELGVRLDPSLWRYVLARGDSRHRVAIHYCPWCGASLRPRPRPAR